MLFMKKNEVYYDGSCPMCTVFADTLEKSSKSETFELVDIQKGILLAGKSLKEMSQEIYVKESDGTLHRNADAILKIIGSFQKWRWVEWIGKLPIINWSLHIGYNIVAQNRHFLFGTASRLFWIKAVLCFGFVASILLSTKLWLSSRTYPFSPTIQGVPQIPFPFDYVILFTLLGCLILATFTRAFKHYLLGAIILVIVLVFLDQSRLQPWVYQYLVMLGCLMLYSWSFSDVEGKNYALNLCRFIIASIYLYSGLQKMNVNFFGNIFPWMIEPISNLFPITYLPSFYYFGLAVPWIEMSIGITLLSTRFRRVGITLATVMCVFVLWTLGGFGHNWNSVVWPWNVTLLLLVYLLFVNTKEVQVSDVLKIWRKSFGLCVVVLFGVLPMTYFLNFWDAYTSWSLYSGTTNQAKVYVSDSLKERLPEYIKSFVSSDSDNRNVLSITDWSFKELNVPPYPESRIYKNITRQLCKKYAHNQEDLVLLMSGRMTLYNNSGRQAFDCHQLMLKE